MNRVMLLGAAGLAASLMAAPVYAQNTGGGGAAGNGVVNNPSSYSNGGNSSATAGVANPNAGMPADNAAMVGNGHYANVGFGSYAAEQSFITNGNGNGGGNGAAMAPATRQVAIIITTIGVPRSAIRSWPTMAMHGRVR